MQSLNCYFTDALLWFCSISISLVYSSFLFLCNFTYSIPPFLLYYFSLVLCIVLCSFFIAISLNCTIQLLVHSCATVLFTFNHHNNLVLQATCRYSSPIYETCQPLKRSLNSGFSQYIYNDTTRKTRVLIRCSKFLSVIFLYLLIHPFLFCALGNPTEIFQSPRLVTLGVITDFEVAF